MNGIHDMGGMHGMGAIDYREGESWYRQTWETRVWGLNRALSPWGRGRWSGLRYELEQIPAGEYLSMSYHERIFSVMVDRLLRTGLITAGELLSGRPDPRRPMPQLLPAPAQARTAARLDIPMDRRFELNQTVRVRNMHPEGHTRLPRYTRGRRGTVVRDNGVFALQDTDVDGEPLGGQPQPVYTVRFEARELWGEQAPAGDAVYVEMWEEYLEDHPPGCG